jgi:hypothetical protein
MWGFTKHVGLRNEEKNHSFINSAVQVLFNLSTLEEVNDVILQEPCSVSIKFLGVLQDMHSLMITGGAASVDKLRAALASAFRPTGLFEGRTMGDPFEAYNAVLQHLCNAAPSSQLVKRFSLQITEKSACRCRSEVQLWRSDCFGLPVYVNRDKGFLGQLKEDFQGKQLQMCLGDEHCHSTLTLRELMEVPKVLAFQLNYVPLGVGMSDMLVAQPPCYFEEAFDLSSISQFTGLYRLKGTVLMVSKHFLTAVNTSSQWTVFDDNSVKTFTFASFYDFMSYCWSIDARPYLLFYVQYFSDWR